MATKRSAPVRLDRDRIVGAAIELADEAGIDALSMRTVARRLGCGVMSLYNHVEHKDELLTLMADAVATDIDDPPAELAPLVALRAVAVSTRAALVAHPWAAELWLRHVPGPARSRHMELMLRLAAETGLSPELAHLGYHAVTNHVLGYTLQELGLAMGGDDPDATARRYLDQIDDGHHPYSVAHVREHLEGRTASSFEVVLDLILDGLVRLDRGADG